MKTTPKLIIGVPPRGELVLAPRLLAYHRVRIRFVSEAPATLTVIAPAPLLDPSFARTLIVPAAAPRVGRRSRWPSSPSNRP